ncbi:hypothetical protein HY642_05530 [Candidatus Woesearchaeota archaeon]|nr:hypothetical protein [Candidatus Woesearchaeota archaeon]
MSTVHVIWAENGELRVYRGHWRAAKEALNSRNMEALELVYSAELDAGYVLVDGDAAEMVNAQDAVRIRPDAVVWHRIPQDTSAG